MIDHELPENILEEYKALREEMLFRLKVQQDVINYSLLFVGFVATILTIQNFDIGTVSIVLLFGPLIGIFLAFVYLKQHLFVQALSGYISELNFQSDSEKGSTTQDIHPFSGWDNYLTESFYKHRLPTLFTGIIGLAEGLFPLLIGTVCLLLFASFSIGNILLKSSLPAYLSAKFGIDAIILLNIWAAIDGLLLIASLVFNRVVRRWVVKQRRNRIAMKTAQSKVESSTVVNKGLNNTVSLKARYESKRKNLDK